MACFKDTNPAVVVQVEFWVNGILDDFDSLLALCVIATGRFLNNWMRFELYVDIWKGVIQLINLIA